jgi:hypothetical protein
MFSFICFFWLWNWLWPARLFDFTHCPETIPLLRRYFRAKGWSRNSGNCSHEKHPSVEASADLVTWELVQSVSSENGRMSIEVPMGDATTQFFRAK